MPIIEHHPVDPSAAAMVSIVFRISIGSASSPPIALGTLNRNIPALRNSSARSRGNRRACSISARLLRIAGRSF
jgi:hypothetical protein